MSKKMTLAVEFSLMNQESQIEENKGTPQDATSHRCSLGYKEVFFGSNLFSLPWSVGISPPSSSPLGSHHVPAVQDHVQLLP